MDGTGFDDLARSLSARRSRRAALVIAVLLGGLGRGALPETALAACRAPGKPCARDKQCCSGRCSTKRGRCLGCPSGQKPCKGACIPGKECCSGCPAGQTCCQFAAGGRCLDLRNDRDFCGRCGTNGNSACPGGAVCANGDCGLTCATVGATCFQGCACGNREDPAHRNQKVCAGLGFFTCDTVTTCNSDADCSPATAGFRQVCVGGLCAGKKVCADPCA